MLNDRKSQGIGMTRAPSKIFTEQKRIGMTRSIVCDQIFHAPGFIYPPTDGIIQFNWMTSEDLNMGRNDACICGSKRKFKKCHNNLQEHSAVANLWSKIHQLDTEIVRQKSEQSCNFFCKAGCHDCCKEYFYVSALEYFLVKNHLLTFKPELFSKVRQESIRQFAVLQTFCAEETQKLSTFIPTLRMMNDKEFLQQFECCPLLDKEYGKCMLYQARTIICRIYGISYSYFHCEQIDQCLKSGVDPKSIMVGVPFDETLQEGMDFSDDTNSGRVLARPYPLFYWFANDEKYEAHYQIAISRPYQDYWRFVSTNGY